MKPVCALAVDLGASHGRVIRGSYDGEKLTMETVSDFPNMPAIINGEYYWDHIALAANVLKGIEAAGEAVSVGVDAWGHDYIPVSENGELIGQMYCYRDEQFSINQHQGDYRLQAFVFQQELLYLP